MNEFHMREEHQKNITSYKLIWNGIKEYHDEEVKKHEKKKSIRKLKRRVFLIYWKPLLQTLKDDTEQKIKEAYEEKAKKGRS